MQTAISCAIDWCIVGSFVAYLVLMLVIGFVFSRRRDRLSFAEFEGVEAA